MGIKVSLEHRTVYTFDRAVRIHPHVVRLRPAPHTRTTIEAYSMRVTPAEHFVNWQQDAFGNYLARLVFTEPARELSVVIGLVADLEAINPFDFFVEEYAEHFPFSYTPDLATDLDVYLRPVDEGEPGSGAGELVRAWVAAHRPKDHPRTIEFLISLNQALRHDVGYTIRMEPGVQTPDHTLRTALGSCRDSAWLLTAILREFGLAARFVSGYLIQLAQDIPSLDGPSGPPADFTDLHAWTEVYLPGAGWVGLDPTSGLFTGEGHIPLAATPHPVSSAAITGATDPVNATLDFSNTVRRIHEDPRTTMPYSDSQWERIAAAGAAVDARTRAAGIGLTIGGEPTFVSIDDQTSPEWTTEADGPHKRERAADLAQRLRAIYAPNGLVQYRQGKWYPGEPLPRWDISLLWRTDNQPLWLDQTLLDDPWLPPDQRRIRPPAPDSGKSGENDGGSRVAARTVALGEPGPGGAAEHENAELSDTADCVGDGGAAEPISVGLSHSQHARTSVADAGVEMLDTPIPGDEAAMLTASVRVGHESWQIPTGRAESLRPAVAGGAAGARSGQADEATRPARELVEHVARGLGLPPSQARPAYEDALLRLAAKTRAPDGEPVHADDDLEPGEDSVQARKALLAALDAVVAEPAAYVLPLYRRADGAGWASADWRLRRGRIVLTEGDSPAGLRLPLGSISWRDAPVPPDSDPLAPATSPRPDEAAVVEPADGAPTTALVAEVRDGRLFVFLPPLEDFDAFCDLVARIEAAAAEVGQPVVLEGYAPPGDSRLQTLSITPDPGVIEVNVQPTSSFAEQARLLDDLYEQARLARLGTESFDVDGTHSGTGGGNHITLGGRTPARSPLLRRPDLLVSMLTYWQRHPSLSYLFSGRFIGPTSQAPRVDEGRSDALYELEIAFAEIARLSAERAGEDGESTSAPWEVDRALRHLLTDLTGNTHRAEFCIDKLYSPETARGRLGLVELRGFEMPPHFRMAMVQSLLVRALVLRFWERPYTAPLLRHGDNLHGRYLLPHFLLADIADVAADLRSHGIEFDISWLEPFAEFRFPRIGTVVLGDMEVELRGAIEPWNTLGEQTTGTGTARYVDSSVERLQVRVVGADRGRYALTCNGFPVPLIAAGKADVQVAGVRYRAWQPPNSLHPSLTVDAPLVFDVVDLETGVSRGGCRYYVSHPGGMYFDSPPVNAAVAQSRRNRRFVPFGHTSGQVDIAGLRAKMAIQATDVGAPGILDLRRARTVWARYGSTASVAGDR
ncbi:transglutaminase family protein [Nocardia sp. CDC160]|uniref:transglutaminase family protein n=1 Tax=Nocardia sp. CDC160 TaxID=3112166 RepID=UPI002DBC01EB|nr:transglutaminase family protein [Nocardia sp. CDC160]MEC3913908.1 transglutaminase family protein [Nocardia sp. CDC160]